MKKMLIITVCVFLSFTLMVGKTQENSKDTISLDTQILFMDKIEGENKTVVIKEKIAAHPEFIFNEVDTKAYIIEDTVIKNNPYDDADDVASLKKYDEINLIGKNELKYWKVNIDGNEYFIDSNKITIEKKVIDDMKKKEEEAERKKKEEAEKKAKEEEQRKAKENKNKAMQDKYGTREFRKDFYNIKLTISTSASDEEYYNVYSWIDNMPQFLRANIKSIMVCDELPFGSKYTVGASQSGEIWIKTSELYDGKAILYHEAGHVLDWANGRIYSGSTTWETISQTEWANDGYNSSIRESFAQAVSDYYVGGLNGKPQTKDAIEKIINTGTIE